MSVKCLLLVCLSLMTVTACAQQAGPPIQGRSDRNSQAIQTAAYGGIGDSVGALNPPTPCMITAEASADPTR